MIDLTSRNIWVRGLTISDRGKNVVIDGHRFLLRNVEHYGGKTYVDVVTRLELDERTEIRVVD